MSNPKEVSPKLLTDRTHRAMARLAMKARCNVVLGGASALVLAKRAQRFRRLSFDAVGVVTQVYTHNEGNPTDLFPYKCPECDSVVLGKNAAAKLQSVNVFTDGDNWLRDSFNGHPIRGNDWQEKKKPRVYDQYAQMSGY